MKSRDNGPHIGVYLSTEPLGGGTYQYSQSILDGLVPLTTENWTLVALSTRRAWAEIVPTAYAFEPVPIPRLRSLVAASYRFIDRTSNGVYRSRRIDGVSSTIDSFNFDLVLFPGQDRVGAQVSVASLVAVHDLMHRYERQFGEYTNRAYTSREARYRAISERATGVLVDSELGKEQMIESYGVDAARVHVLPFVTPPYLDDPTEVDVVAKYRLPDRYFFYPAQFWEHKNHVRLLEAVASCRRSGIAIHLALAGSPKNAYRSVLRKMSELKLENQVSILGYAPNEDMYSLYKSSVGTVFLSLIGPTSIPPLEAMAVGSPLIASRRYAMEEQVSDAAVLVDPLDVEDIARGLIQVWTDSKLREELIERGYRRSQQWTRPQFGDRLRAIVKRVTYASES